MHALDFASFPDKYLKKINFKKDFKKIIKK